MINRYVSSNCVIVGSKIILNGEQIPPPPGKREKYKSVTTVNGKIYIDGYEFIDGQWKKTLMALWHKLI